MKKILVLILIIILFTGGWLLWKKKTIQNSPKCGGIAGLSCPAGYECKGMATYPDAQGYCKKI